MGRAYASGNKAEAFCDRCGFQYKLHDLRDEVVDMHETGLKVCPECWDPDQPQLQVGRWPVNDPQALRSPRPNGQDGGREDGWLVYDFKESAEGWRTGYGTVTHNPDTESITWSYDFDTDGAVEAATIAIEDGESLSYGTTDFAVNTAFYRYVRFRVKFLELPDPIDPRGGSAGLGWYRFSSGAFNDGFHAERVPEYIQMGSDYHDIIFDMNGKRDGAENIQWTGSIRRMRMCPFTMAAGMSFKIEFLGIYFEPIRVQPRNSERGGVTNYDFSTPVFQRTTGSMFTTTAGDRIVSVPGWTATAGKGYVDGRGHNNGNVGVSCERATPSENKAYLRPWDREVSISQITSTIIEANTKYTLSVGIYRNVTGPKILYATRMKSDGSTLAEDASSLTPDQGISVTSEISYAATGSDANIGTAIEVQVANTSTLDDADVEGQFNCDNVLLTSSPQLTYDFLAGTATETSGSGTYGIEGWAHWEGGVHPIEDSLTWDASNKTVTLATPSLGESNPWDTPYFTYWDERSPGVSADVSTSRYSSVTIRMRLVTAGASTTRTWKGRFYWVQQARVDNGQYAFSANAYVSDPSFVLDEWQDVTWEMSGNADWYNEGTATGFRFDFYGYATGDTDTKDIFEVDYVRFT